MKGKVAGTDAKSVGQVVVRYVLRIPVPELAFGQTFPHAFAFAFSSNSRLARSALNTVLQYMKR